MAPLIAHDVMEPGPSPAILTGPGAWQGHDLRLADATVRLDGPCLAELARVVADLGVHRLETVLLSAEEYALPACRAKMAEIRKALDFGVGFVLVDRIPVEEWALPDATVVFWLLSGLIARPVAQKLDGTMVYDVCDTGATAAPGSGIRRDRTNSELTPHTDNSYNRTPPDYVGLLCVRPARRGPTSRMVSLPMVHNEIRRRAPELLARFYQPYWFDRQRECRADEEPVSCAPIFCTRDGSLATRVSLHQIRGGYRLRGDAMDTVTARSLDLLDEIFSDPRMSVEFSLESGFIQYVNNRTIGHSRTAFEDYPEPERKRLLIRLWLRDGGRRSYAG